jgi:hypothetical protein
MRFIWVWTKCFAGLALIAAAYWFTVTWIRGEIYAGHWSSWFMLMALMFTGSAFFDLFKTGEISIFGRKIRPKWAQKPPKPTAPVNIVELRPHEYRRER